LWIEWTDLCEKSSDDEFEFFNNLCDVIVSTLSLMKPTISLPSASPKVV
jgi:hypothetical protein